MHHLLKLCPSSCTPCHTVQCTAADAQNRKYLHLLEALAIADAAWTKIESFCCQYQPQPLGMCHAGKDNMLHHVAGPVSHCSKSCCSPPAFDADVALHIDTGAQRVCASKGVASAESNQGHIDLM